MPESNNSHITSNIHLDWIDVSKGIGIILVVFAHKNYTPYLVETLRKEPINPFNWL